MIIYTSEIIIFDIFFYLFYHIKNEYYVRKMKILFNGIKALEIAKNC